MKNKTSIDVRRASHTHHVPQIGLPQIEPVTRVIKANPAPIGAAATAKTYEILVLHTKQEKLQIAIKVYIPRLIHAAGTCTYIILTISFCW